MPKKFKRTFHPDLVGDHLDYRKKVYLHELCEAAFLNKKKKPIEFFTTRPCDLLYYQKNKIPIFKIRDLIWGQDFWHERLKFNNRYVLKYSKDYLNTSIVFNNNLLSEKEGNKENEKTNNKRSHAGFA